MAGSHPDDYNIGEDLTIFHSGSASGHINSRGSTQGFGTLMQMSKAEKYIGKRVRMSGFVKAERVANWAGLWMRVDGPDEKSVSFDNMKDRPIKGTIDWQEYEIVLDVPENSVRLAYGLLLNGEVQIWMDDLQFKVVGEDIPLTDLWVSEELPDEPINLSFEDTERE